LLVCSNKDETTNKHKHYKDNAPPPPPQSPDGILQYTVNMERKKCRFGWQTLIFLSVISNSLLLLLAQLCSHGNKLVSNSDLG